MTMTLNGVEKCQNIYTIYPFSVLLCSVALSENVIATYAAIFSFCSSSNISAYGTQQVEIVLQCINLRYELFYEK